MSPGYTYHGQPYPSQPVSKADNLGYEYSDEKNAEILALWHKKVEDVVARVEQQAGLNSADLYIRAPLHPDAQLLTFDYVLRQVLRERGHRIISDRYAGIILTYDLYDPDLAPEKIEYSYHEAPDNRSPDDFPVHISEEEYQPMAIEMEAFDKTTPIAYFLGTYAVPTYGFEVFDLTPFWQPVGGQVMIKGYSDREKRFNE